MSTGYNGWSNYETWCVNLWVDNEPGGSDYWRERAEALVQSAIDDDETDPKASAVTALEDEIQSQHEENAPEVSGVYSDLLTAALGAVDWREIAHHYIDDVTVYSAGWNMPGYMPDNVPALFTDCDAAREYIAEQLERAADEGGDTDEEPANAAADSIRAGSGDLGVTVGQYHYFVTAV